MGEKRVIAHDMHSLKEFEPLLPAERRLVDQISTGSRVEIGDGNRPDDTAADVEIRAGLERMILLELDPTVVAHAIGIRIRDAGITGVLDFQGVDCGNDLRLSLCILMKKPFFVNARMQGVYLSGCTTPGISADNAEFQGSLFLRNGFESEGEISLSGSQGICKSVMRGSPEPEKPGYLPIHCGWGDRFVSAIIPMTAPIPN